MDPSRLNSALPPESVSQVRWNSLPQVIQALSASWFDLSEFYLTFSLLMGRCMVSGLTPILTRPIQTRFPYGSVSSNLTSYIVTFAISFYKAPFSPINRLELVVGSRFPGSVIFTLPYGVLFSFSSTGSLSVTKYLGLGDGHSTNSRRDLLVSAVLGILLGMKTISSDLPYVILLYSLNPHCSPTA